MRAESPRLPDDNQRSIGECLQELPACLRGEILSRPAARRWVVDEYKYAKELAIAIWKEKYRNDAPDWEPLDDLGGVLTQIDNMICGWIGNAYDNDRIAALERENEVLRKEIAYLKAPLCDEDIDEAAFKWGRENTDLKAQLAEALKRIEMLEDQDMPSVGSYAKRYDELREAVAWFFECIDLDAAIPPMTIWSDDLEYEFLATFDEAADALRAMLKEAP